MHFLEGGFLWHLVWALPLLGVLLWLSWRRRSAILSRLFGGNVESHLNLSKPLRLLRFALLAGAVGLLGIAAARPSWGVQILPSGGSGRDLLVVFDVSKSMLCKDVQPSRLEHGKWFVRELVRRSHGDRFGLVAFAGTAFLECPLTSDKTSFLQALNELNIDSIPVGGTNLQNALETALKAFKAAESGHRAIVLVTDGDELTGDSSKAIERARETKTPLFVVGVGDPAQPQIIQAPDESGAVKTVKDASGEAVKSPLNEKALGSLALQSGGIYVRSTSANTGFGEISSRVAGLVPKDYDLGRQTRPIERFVWPLAGAFALFLIWLCVSERGFRRAAALFAFACALSLSAAEDAKKVVDVPPSPLETFNKAVDLQRAGKDAATAAKLYEDAINKSPADKELVARSCQNLGVIAHGQAREELKKSVDENLKGQDLDGAEKRVESALKALTGAENLYREGLRTPDDGRQGLKVNQQSLLLDRAAAEKLKKRIEEIRKQIEQAQKDLQQAQQQQQKQNQQGKQQNQQQNKQQRQGQQQQQQNQQQGQQNQQQQQQQNQQQGQQGQQGQQQNSVQQAAQNAKESVDKLKDMASSMEQKRLEDSAERSSKEIDKARQAQDKGDGKAAEKHLKEALKQLEQAEKDKRDQDKKDGQKQDASKGKDGDKDKQQPGSQDGKDQDRKLDKPKDAGKPKDSSEPKDEKEIAPEQAESVLESMANDEKSLRDAIKRNQREAYGQPRVEKDW